jgi:hypothetical protein
VKAASADAAHVTISNNIATANVILMTRNLGATIRRRQPG